LTILFVLFVICFVVVSSPEEGEKEKRVVIDDYAWGWVQIHTYMKAKVSPT